MKTFEVTCCGEFRNQTQALGLEAQTTKKVRLNPIYDMKGGAGGTVDVFGRFESQIQQRSDFL